MDKLAEEVGVEPTRHTIGASLVLKTRRPTGDIALPYLKRHSTLQSAAQVL
jgi:hypothetical protein